MIRRALICVLAVFLLVTQATAATASHVERREAARCNLECQWYRGVLAQHAAARALLEQVREQDRLADEGNCLAIVAVAARWWPRAELPNVRQVVRHESSPEFDKGRCNPRAENPNGKDKGLTQLRMPLHADMFRAIVFCGDWPRAMLNAVCNLHAAFLLWAASGGSWHPHWNGAI